MRPRSSRRLRTALTGVLACAVAAGALGAAGTVPASAGTAPGAVVATTAPLTGNDISWPQCGSPYPPGAAFGIVGVNDGRPGTLNPCVGPSATYPSSSQSELYWAVAHTAGGPGQPGPALYVNTADPGSVFTGAPVPDWPTSGRTPYGTCTTTTVQTTGGTAVVGADSQACAWEYGDRSGAQDTAWLTAAAGAVDGQSPPVPVSGSPSAYPWWLDVETANTWLITTAAPVTPAQAHAMNTADLQGMVAGLEAGGAATVGVYSTSYQWGVITGGTTAASGSLRTLPDWVPGAGTLPGAVADCTAAPFTTGPVLVTQFPDGLYDGDYACPARPTVATPKVSLTTAAVASTDVTYTVGFTTSASGALAAGDTVTLVAPAGTALPAAAGDYALLSSGPVALSGVAVGPAGSSPTANAAVLTLSAPVGSSAAVTVTVQGATSTTVAGTQHLAVGTTVDAAAAASFALSPGPPSAARSTVSVSPTTVSTGSPVIVMVTVTDAYGNARPGDAVVLSATGTATITPGSATTSGGGTATFTLADPVAQVVTLTASDGSTVLAAHPVVTVVSSGYDLVGADGGVFVFPPPGTTGGYYGSLPGLGVVPAAPVVGMVPTTTDRGYFLVGADGGVFSFGDAPFLGSLPGLGVVPSAPITGIVTARTDTGYFLVGADGGVFAFGTVPFSGSLPGMGVHRDDIVGIAATPDGSGYWVVAADGAVYAFGTAMHLGTATATTSPVSAIAGTPTGGGYWVVAADGAVAAFGAARSFGTLPSLGVTPTLPVIGIVHTVGTAGYWLIGADGGIFAFGAAGFIGSLPALGVRVTDVVGAVPTRS